MGATRAIKRVGFVGLGNMGGPMCGHLARAGFEVTAYDLNGDSRGRSRPGLARGPRRLTAQPGPTR